MRDPGNAKHSHKWLFLSLPSSILPPSIHSSLLLIRAPYEYFLSFCGLSTPSSPRDAALWHHFILPSIIPLILPSDHNCLSLSLWRLLIRVLCGSSFRISKPPLPSPPKLVSLLPIYLNIKLKQSFHMAALMCCLPLPSASI